MSELPERLVPKSEQVAATVMDGEAVIINLVNGVYYSMDEVGGLVWNMIEQACSLTDIADAVAVAYGVESSQVREDIQQLAAQLIEEDLVTVAGDQTPAKGAGPASPPPEKQYEAPKLVAYRDMQDLLAVDPPLPGLQDMPWTDDDSPRD